ncbi:MAG TPA: hypothetical protein VFO69_05875 [Allosphingosinicella sp.]|nr:hypothetical protein [Allosphingosinicella sp.]
MPKFHPEAFLFCLAWAALAIAGAIYGSWWIGALISVGLLILVSAASLQVLSQTGDEDMERNVRWGILMVTALALFVGLSFFG